MTILSIIIITVIATIALASICMLIYNARKNGQAFPLDKIRPIIEEVIIQVIEVRKTDKLGYDAVLQYAVQYVMQMINKATFLTPVEKALLSEDLIMSVLKPKLEELYRK
jgi:flagellar basal body-associated protein FliL